MTVNSRITKKEADYDETHPKCDQIVVPKLGELNPIRCVSFLAGNRSGSSRSCPQK